MIDSAHLKRLLLGTAALFLVASAAAVTLGAPLAFAGGLALGYFLGAAPFASWTWVLSRAMGGKRGTVIAVLLLAAKLGIYSGVLYLGVTRTLVHPVGVLAGITAVALILILGSLLSRTAAAKEAA
jgi:hypothetical protein